MNIEIDFLLSNSNVNQCPKDNLPEIALIGRSNVGKSSFINFLSKSSKTAKISSTPGKTRLINHFIINKKLYMVDLPGYGYAKLSKTDRAKLSKMIESYFDKRTQLTEAFVLIDVNLPPQEIDIKFINNLGEKGIPFSLIFTKSDKISKSKVKQQVAKFNKKLKEYWEILPNFFVSSIKLESSKEPFLEHISLYMK